MSAFGEGNDPHHAMLRNLEVAYPGDLTKCTARVAQLQWLNLEANLLSSWTQVAEIVAASPDLKCLRLGQNRFESLDTRPTADVHECMKTSFQGLRVLTITNCGIRSWAEIQTLQEYMPNLEELSLAYNPLADMVTVLTESRHRDIQEKASLPGAPADDAQTNPDPVPAPAYGDDFGVRIEAVAGFQVLVSEGCLVGKPGVGNSWGFPFSGISDPAWAGREGHVVRVILGVSALNN